MLWKNIREIMAETEKISQYMQAAYRYPENFNDFVYASQLLQADGIRYGVEDYRRNRDGAIYWQLNDIALYPVSPIRY